MPFVRWDSGPAQAFGLPGAAQPLAAANRQAFFWRVCTRTLASFPVFFAACFLRLKRLARKLHHQPNQDILVTRAQDVLVMSQAWQSWGQNLDLTEEGAHHWGGGSPSPEGRQPQQQPPDGQRLESPFFRLGRNGSRAGKRGHLGETGSGQSLESKRRGVRQNAHPGGLERLSAGRAMG